MIKSKTYNILMYSHDTYGLGHIRRTMAIASSLRERGINILILTGSPLAGRFDFPPQIDFIRIPGMIKKTNEEYFPLSIKINPGHAMDIRQSIIAATAKAFRPDLFIVDKEPLGLKKEILPTLRWIKKHLPRTKTVMGLRDIMDDAETIKENWHRRGTYDVFEKLYSEIWVYGVQEIYDPAKEYEMQDSIREKMHFTGYIPRREPEQREIIKERKSNGIKVDDKLVVVTTGGGGDGSAVIEAYLGMIRKLKHDLNGEIPFQSIVITGPFMSSSKRKLFFRQARELGIKAFHFYRQMEKLMAGADVVVTMGGYNTLCELMTLKIPGLVIPRETPRLEQLIRAQRFHSFGYIDYIRWNELTPESLAIKIFALLENPLAGKEAMLNFPLTGIEVMKKRIESFRG
ncbi:Glycosyltransferase 28 domain protein [Desulfamplus magnetovallimortis]|uniref:Glycosyltransferase 28 domain protein n=1 Tax=Desulfamplus magnetovallimortis TaxID=1246637 RepID=A0A1W1H6C5_9BACT|nr:glycosyltransferase [Desulfamplus magnetovallimortis]SLM28041.1 Glycosyltransferase 28 domain protein [Desulfamplus magnetovallimortis]